MAPKNSAMEMEKNKFAKFTTLKNAGQLTLKPQNMSPSRNDGNKNQSDWMITTQQLSYGVGEKKLESSHKMENGEIVAAVGRSGARVEKGLRGSGLTGEKLNASNEPSKNSFVQRMWMYGDDSALYYRQDGVPEAAPVEDLSLPIGKGKDPAKSKLSKMRSSTDLMFNPIGKTGYKVFQDDECGETANLEYHYKC